MIRKAAEKLFLALIAFYTTIEIKGKENIPKGPCILCSNHSSHSDSIFLMKAMNENLSNMAYVAAYDYWFENRIRWFLFKSIMKLIPIDRRPKEQRKVSINDTIKYCKNFLSSHQKGKIVFYATGSRNKGSTQIKPGIIILSTALNIPILPIYLQNTDMFFEKKSKWFKHTHITITIYPSTLFLVESDEVSGKLKQNQIDFAVDNLEKTLYQSKKL